MPVVVWEEALAVPELHRQHVVVTGWLAELALHPQTHVPVAEEAVAHPEVRQMTVAQAAMVADGLVPIQVVVVRDRTRVHLHVMAYLIAVILYPVIPAILELLELPELPVQLALPEAI